MAKETKEEKVKNLAQEKEKLKESLKINDLALNSCQTRIDSRNKVIDKMNIKLINYDEDKG